MQPPKTLLNPHQSPGWDRTRESAHPLQPLLSWLEISLLGKSCCLECPQGAETWDASPRAAQREFLIKRPASDKSFLGWQNLDVKIKEDLLSSTNLFLLTTFFRCRPEMRREIPLWTWHSKGKSLIFPAFTGRAQLWLS